MQQLLGNFIHALRQAGVPVSAAETLDALTATELVGIEDSSILKLSLATTLAKSLEHRLVHDQLFDQFFSQQALTSAASPPGKQSNSVDHLRNQDTTDKEPNPDRTAESPNPLSELAQNLIENNSSELQVMIAAAASDANAKDMTLFTQIPMLTYQVMQALGDGQLQQDIMTMAATDEHSAALELLQHRRKLLQQQVRDHIEQQYLMYGQNKPRKLREKSLSKIQLTSIDHTDYKLMSELVRKAAKRLASMHNRRRKVTKRGLLDVRRTIAANAAYDGFLFHTKWKSSRIDRAKIMVICDISGSVSRVARFLLLFFHSLQDVLPAVRSFVFCSDMTEVTELLKEQDKETALAQIINNWANLPTNYGKALSDLETNVLNDIDNRTTVIMLGDARNNYGNANIEVWEEVYRRSRRVLWLNPESQFSWDTGDSIMAQYRPYCSHVETCNSLNDLNRILNTVLKYSH